jgi:two-component system, chemotaxis family, sensor kinase CheA
MLRPDGDMHALFLDDATESVAELESTLLQLEQAPDDHEALDHVVRIVGSVKGRSALMRCTEMARFTHAIEDLLHQLRSGLRPVTPLVVDALLAAVDVLRGLIARISADPEAAGQSDENAERVRGLLASLVEEPRGITMARVELHARLPRSV